MLKIDNLESGYGKVLILKGITLHLERSECIAVLGRNGMGKTTLLRSVMGLLPTTGGTVRLGAQLLTGLPANQIARAGLAYVPQGRGIFPRLTVEENLRIGTRAAKARTTVPLEVFEYFPVLKERLGDAGGTLSGGQQQMLAIARALCSGPSVLLLDEPSEGIQPNLVHQLAQTFRRIRDKTGVAILLVEQNIDLALSLAERVLVIQSGTVVLETDAKRSDITDLSRMIAI